VLLLAAQRASTAASAEPAPVPDAERPATRVVRPALLPSIRLSRAGRHLVRSDTDARFIVWGVNYDHDEAGGRLIEDYWHEHWPTVVEDLREIRQLKANTVRIHLQLPRFMDAPEQVNERNLAQLAKLLRLAERTGLYLDITGLGCYHKQDVPAWYDRLDEPARWEVQARFWRAVAQVCRDSPAVLCYDLMNEPILPGTKPETEWLTGELGGKHFVQRITLDLAERSRLDVARDWVQRLTSAIREVDEQHLITVGVIPWAHVFKGARPIFYAPEVAGPLDLTSVHFYPRAGRVDEALKALKVYDVGKPLVVEEIFPLHCSMDEAAAFIDQSRTIADGWISFYWGRTIEQYQQQGDLKGAIIAQWLRKFREMAPRE